MLGVIAAIVVQSLPANQIQVKAGLETGGKVALPTIDNNFQFVDEKEAISLVSEKITQVKENKKTVNGVLKKEEERIELPKKKEVIKVATKKESTNSKPTPVTYSGSIPSLISKWALVYGVDPNRAVRIAMCESGLNPAAVSRNGLYYGLYQQSITYWPARAASAGIPGANPLDAEANIRVSMMMMAQSYNHWPVCSQK